MQPKIVLCFPKVTDATFEQEVIAASDNKLLLVFFYTNWASPCRIMHEALKTLIDQKKINNECCLAYDCDESGALAPSYKRKYNIIAVPTLMFIYGKGEKKKILWEYGNQPADIIWKVIKKIKSAMNRKKNK
jgi:thioredoxin-like negative regulator of GroEL